MNNLVLVRKKKDDKEQEVYDFYFLKTVSWAEDRGYSSWFSGHEIKRFSILSDTKYEVIPNCNIFLIVYSNGTLDLCLQRNIKLTKHWFNKHPKLADWWIGEIEEKDLELLLTEFSNTVSLSHRNGEEFKEAFYSI